MMRFVRRSLRKLASQMGITAVSTRNVPFGFDWLLDINRLSQLWSLRAESFFDVGANDGAVSLRILSHFPKARLTAFEPHPSVFPKLEAVGRRHDFATEQIAMADYVGRATLYAPSYDKMSSLIQQAPSFHAPVETQAIDVDVTTLDDFCSRSNKRVNVLKIDVEGLEAAVLRGAEQCLKGPDLNFVYLEFSSMTKPEKDQSGALAPLADVLLPFGFRFVASYTEQVGSADRFSLVSNALFVRTPEQPTTLTKD